MATAPKTVFMLDGFGADNIIPLQIKGYNLKKPNTTVHVVYDNRTSSLKAVVDGAATLDAALHNKLYINEIKEVRTYSMGGSVAQYWLRHYGPTSDLDPAKLSFLLMANPERRGTGFTIVAPTLVDAWFTPDVASKLKPYLMQYDGVGIPLDSPYPVTDLAVQYDGVADCPNRPSPTADAITNAGAGILTLHNFGYWQIDINAKQNRKWQDGTYTQILAPTYPLPMILEGFFFNWLSSVKTNDKKKRTAIEACYARHLTPPTPNYDSWMGVW